MREEGKRGRGGGGGREREGESGDREIWREEERE